MSYQSLLNALARTVGGTQPTAGQAAAGSGVPLVQQPYWFSGADAGDASGVSGLAGCFSVPTEKITLTPVAMILPDSWAPNALTPYPTAGHKYRDDRVVVRVFTGNAAMQVAISQLNVFADAITDAFDHHMQAFGEANVGTVDCSVGRFLEVDWGGGAFFAIDFRVTVLRGIPVTRTA